ncbi:amino acid adenylation domain-containing protein [Zopfia rhizophila CBS 207.26]|uniref:Amino acid adenylation domain-containing protein n=1 Tax=Zopfia rhizophila CBS 207.26 TaxID=1314779 RepID=A0A6A6DGI6_9PEZI|nr:amino acid adenylation domain-containing protein [Zopfia rhizophila CBS 207.26]
MFLEVDIKHLTKIRGMAEGNKEQFVGVLRTAWALVLRCYTGTRGVCFGYREIGLGNVIDGPREAQDAFIEPIVEYRAPITGDELKMGELAKRYPYNTTVELRALHSSTTFQNAAASARPKAILDEVCCQNHIYLRVEIADGGPNVFLDFDSSMMSIEEACGVVSTLDKTLTEILQSPTCTVGELDYLGEWSRQKLREWNSAPLQKVERCIHEVIRDRVENRPEKEAVCAWDGNLTFAELDDISTTLACRLVKLGVGPETFVPLCFHKSKWAVVSMLAVLKAGGAFVPLDPTHPIPRLQSLSRRINAKVLLCSRVYAESLTTVADTVIPIDDNTLGTLSQYVYYQLPHVAPDNAAYIIFTSGTTGEPKGATIEHAAFCSSAKAHGPAIHICPESRVLQFAAHTFDSSLIETLTPLMVGACVCIPNEEARLNDIASAMTTMQVNLAILTPSFVGFIHPAQVPELKTLVLAGEAMSKEHVSTWSHINLVNGYGPTECAVSAIINPSMRGMHPANVGRPVGGHCWLVDPKNHNRLVPVGCSGELLVEGPTLARGYLNDEKRTSEAFIRDPLWAPGRRFYKTGDLLRYNSNGTLHFVGRKDTQVKVHGQRVELGEIEHHLSADVDVRHGLILLPKEGPCKRKIVAIMSLAHEPDGQSLQLVAESPTGSTAKYVSALRNGLSARLPVYMIPSVWIVVESIPLLSSGKLDRKRVGKWVEDFSDELYRHTTEVAQLEESSSRPANEIETKLRQIWSHVLNLDVDQIGLNRSFLNLGGDSISAMQVMSQCQRLGIGLKVQAILRSKSIAHLANYAKDVKICSDYREVVEQEFDLTPIQQHYFMLPNQGNGYFNQSVFLRTTRRIDESTLRKAIETIIERHSMLRARFSRTGPGGPWRQRITQQVSQSYRLRHLLVASQEETTSHIAASHACLDAVRGPLFAADLFQVGDREQLLFLTANHLVIDLVSWRVILEETEEILSNPSAPLLAQTVMPFQAWCNLQAEHCQGLSPSEVFPVNGVPYGDLEYWGMENVPNNYGGVVSEGFELNTDSTALVIKKCHYALRTEHVDVLLSALIYSFALIFPGRTVPPVYNEGHGREPWDDSIDISRTVGWFTSLYPVFVPNEACRNAVDIVRHVKDLRRRVPNNGRPYFATRFLTAQGKAAFSDHWPMELAFNYLGQYQQLERAGALLQPVEELVGEARGAGGTADVGENAPRFALFEVSAVVAQGKLRFSFTFNRRLKHQGEIRRWISACYESLGTIAEKLSNLAPEPTLADFPLLPLSYSQLEALVLQRLPEKGIQNIQEVEEIYPCSPMQRGLLLSRTKNSNFYAVHGISEVVPQRSAGVDPAVLEDAWRTVISRHAALRTIFAESLNNSDGLYSQIVLKDLQPDIARLSCDDDAVALDTLINQPPISYDDGKRPPHRFTICQTMSGKVYCKLEISHTIMDGASMSVLFRDLALAYEGRLEIEPRPLFSDYIAHLDRQSFESGMQYWESYLDGIEPCHIPVLTDGVAASPKQLRSLKVSFEKLRELQDFCNIQRVTLSNVCHVAWAMTLRCFLGTDQPCFGYLTSGRDPSIPNSENAIGPFINMLVCRLDLKASTSLSDVLDQVQRDYVESLPHRHTPLAEVQHALNLSGTALFNTIISYRKLPPVREPDSMAITFSERVPNHDPTEYNVSINVEATDNTAAIDLNYWTDTISDGQAENIASTFVHSLKNILYNADCPIGQLDNLSERNHHQIGKWNCSMPGRIDSCIHWIFEQQVKLRPQAAALRGWDHSFTFEQLDLAASRVAHLLIKFGIAPETYVPLCFDKSAWTIVAMLGVLKAGGACVPMDPTHPRSALEVRIRDAHANVVLTSPHRAQIFESMVPNVISVGPSLLEVLPSVDCPACPAVRPHNSAFIIFTSGSTGTPKAVVLEHRSLVTSFNAHGSALCIGQDTRMLQFSTYTFDNSIEEMFTTLTRGGCVCIPSEHDRMNDLAGVINRFKVNFCCLTPTVASFLEPRDVPTLKDLALGGEPLTKKNIEVWSEYVRLHGQYGPSECSIDSVLHVGIETGDDPTNLGRSVGCVSWLVDPSNYNRLVPIGCVGELMIEGPIVSRGYLNFPERTAMSFIENPKWSLGQELSWVKAIPDGQRRMYKTGDLVRYNSDGTMTYLGRIDTQIKLHGQRIELGEIEHHVKASLSETVQSAVELVSPGGKEALAVFLCAPLESTDQPSNEDVLLPIYEATRALAKKVETSVSSALASYMVPSLYIPVARMPMTSSGKLDRRALRALVRDLSDDVAATYRLAGRTGRAPATNMEKTITTLWEDVLTLEPNTVGAEDNFFRLGGDSIRAMRLVTAARLKGVVLTVANIFQRPKLEDMAHNTSLIRDDSRSEVAQLDIKPFSLIQGLEDPTDLKEEITGLCQVDLDSIEDIYPCTSIQEGLMALSMKDPGAYVAHNIYRLNQRTDLKRFKEAWRAVVQSESILRTRTVYVKDRGFFQVVVRESINWCSAVDLEGLSGSDCNVPAYNGGRLTQYTIVGEDTDAPCFIWTIHHALYDGWCFPLILKRIENCYQSPQSAGSAPATAYQMFIKYLSQIDMSESDSFWRATLSDTSAPQFPQLPQPAYQARATSFVKRTIEVSHRPDTEVTMPSRVRAAWALAVAIFSGSDDVVFGETMTGRDAPVPGISDMIGPTLATVPSRVKINRENTVGTFLKEVQAQSARVLPFQNAGIQRIKRLCPDAAAACEFQNLLAINHGADDPLDDSLWSLQDSSTIGTNFYIHPLMVSCTVSKGKVYVDAHYDQDVISAWQVGQLLQEFETILQRFNEESNLQEKIGNMRLLSAADEDAIREWNGETLTLVDECAHHTIEEQVRILPNGTEAVCSWDASFTYRQLDDLAATLARFLRSLGVGPEVTVPLCFEKSAWTIVAMLAVLKSGGAFVPLDPASPVARLRNIVEDVRARLLLCSTKYQIFCEALAGKVIPVNKDTIDQMLHVQYPLPVCSSKSAAYIIYTSGSTGNPKGTLVEHSAFCTAAASHGPSMRMDSSTRALQFSSYTFDVSLLEILTTLGLGGCVCIPSETARLNDIASVINEMRINWASLTPSFAQLIRPSAVPTLRTLALLGEPMSQNHLSTWAGKVKLLNAYGPTECAVITTVKEMDTTTEPTNIGRPVGGRCWIADKCNHDRLIPIGSIGELLVEGPVLARGYLNNEQKTEEVFVRNLKWANGDVRVYKTGDLVGYAPNGDLMFIGRKDTQTKVRGQRLELGEVEFRLRTDPLIQHALVAVPSNGFCSKRLVAVLSLRDLPDSRPASSAFELVVHEEASPYLPKIRDRLCDWLPSYMIPSTWIVLQGLPLLSSGKLNRRRVVEWIEQMSEDTYREVSKINAREVEVKNPKSDVEKKLQQIWGHILNLPTDQIPLNQSFLLLGGDSISAMQVMARCRADGLGVTVRDIIRSKSIAELAALATATEHESYEVEDSDKPFDLSPIQRLFFDCVGNNWRQFNQSVLLRLRKHTESSRIIQAIKTVVNAHSMLRARFGKDVEGTWYQSISQDVSASFRFRVHEYSGDIMNDLNIKTSIEESQKSLDILNGPVLAVDVFESTNSARQLLCLAAHHLVIDVVSWRVILQDLEDILGTGKAKIQSSLPFQTWCRVQSEAQPDSYGGVYPSDEVPRADFAYWGMAEKQNLSGDAIRKGFEVDANTTSKLLGYCHSSLNAEPLDLFLASLLHSFQRVFSDRPVLPAIYNEGHGRETWDPKQDLSRTVGWFTTMCPVFSPTLPAKGGHEIVDLVRWIKDLRSRVPGKGRPYFAYRLLTKEGRERFSDHWPMEVTFNYLGHYQQFERQDALLQPADSLSGQSINVASNIGYGVPRFALFDISASVTQGSISFSFTYNRHMQRQSSIRQWISQCQRTLQDAADQLVRVEPKPSLSDFPLVPLTFNGVAKLAEKLSHVGVSALEQIEDVYPCSPMQQGILFSQMRNPKYYAYSSIFEARSTREGQPVDIRTLAQAWQSVVYRYSTMRTIFVDGICKEGEVGQVVLKQCTARVEQLESNTENAEEILNRQQPADYRNGQPPHRLTLCRSPTGRVFCKLEISHALVDGSSIPILIRKLTEAYENTAEEGHISLYSEYIARLLRTPQKLHVKFWKNYLADVEPCYFPVINDGASGDPALRCYKLQLTRTAELQAFCMKRGVTLSNVLQLVWGLVLRCYTGSNEVCFGYLTSGRDAPVQGIQDAIGTFINILICRINLTDDLHLEKALDKIQFDYINSIAHQSCSLAEVQHELNLAGSSIFNSAFTFQNRSNVQNPVGSTVVFDVLRAQDPSEYNLTVNAEAWESSITVSFTYWTDRVSDAQAVNLANTFDHVLQGIVQGTSQARTIGELDLLSGHGWKQILDWNKSLPGTVEKCIHEMIDEHALLRPAFTPAVCAWDASFTFVELERTTALLASHLVSIGVRPGVYVPLCFEKSAWYIVAMLAVMKAGGAFIPLDPTHPIARLKVLIETVDSSLLLCSKEYEGKASAVAKMAVVVDHSSVNSLASLSGPFRSAITTPPTLAYIIFTSGTTGIPKGTMIEHGAFCTSATEHAQTFYIGSSSRVYQFASYTFDASIMEIFTTLIAGGCVCVPSEEERMNDIPRSIRRMDANWLCLTPSVADTLQPESIPGVRVLILAGEAMSSRHITKWSGRKLCLINGYGPSETCVVATTGVKVDKDGNIIDMDPSNIGSAVGCRSWVTDPRDYNRLVPIGCVGELVVEGRTVGRGYVNNEQKTKEVFVNDVAWMKQGPIADALLSKERMYRTGDLVRYNSDGTLTFVSRKDTQIKLNGQRIELGEIETHVMANIPHNSQASVELLSLKRKVLAVFYTLPDHVLDVPTEKDYATIFASDPTMDDLLLPMSDTVLSSARAIHAGLTGDLPSYMIPSLYIPVAKLPWTKSGKLDRRRLKTMVYGLSPAHLSHYNIAANSSGRLAPTTHMETKLQRAWASVLSLSLESIGAEDNFFGLGGDSISAMKLVSAARKEGVSLAVGDILRNPKLSEMSRTCQALGQETELELQPFALLGGSDRIDQVLDELAKQCAVSKDEIQDAYPCSSLQEGLITLSMKQSGAYVARNVFLLPQQIDLDRFKHAWQKTLEDVDILRTRIVHTSTSSFVQVVLQNRSIKWHLADSLKTVSEESMPLKLQNGGELTRYTIIQDTESNERYFVWSLHHALYDGWSLPMVLKRVEEFYFDCALDLPKASYAQFINYLVNTDARASEEFWKNRLSGTSPLHFPQSALSAADVPRKSATLTHSMDLPLEPTGLTLPTLIKSAWALVVSAYVGLDEVIFGETLTGRDIPVPEITDIVGPTFTTVPTRIRVDHDLTVKDYAQNIQQMVAETIPHQHTGLQHIRRLNSDTSLACEFQNLLVIQSAEEKLRDGFLKPQSNGVGNNFFTYPLVVECSTGNSRVQFCAYHDENLISGWEVQRLLYQFDFVLQQLSTFVRVDSKKVGEVQIFSPQDHELVSSWNGHEARVLDECLHDTFIRTASSQPDAPAVCAWDGQFTYGEVNEYAGRIAQRLIKAGVGPEVLVPFCMDKSAWNAVVTLGILMAGGAFVPLDPSHPTSRHEEIIKDTKARVLLCSPHYQHRYAKLVEMTLAVDGESISGLPPCHHPTEHLSHAAPSNVAYVIFTSGSTGKPKGVQIQHRACSSSSLGYREALRMRSTSRVFQFASLCFDAAIMEVLTTLTYGGCICVPDDEERLNDLSGAIARMEVSWAFFTPSVANIIDPASVPCLKTLVVGGELLPIEIINKWGEKVELINAYGPTEASVVTSGNFEVARNKNPLNIGKPHTGGFAWISDPSNVDRLAPVGCIGELLLEGPFLSRGYLNDEEKTTQAFVENPAWSQAFRTAPCRVYKTGDLVRYDSDGALLFVGRKDGQVKLHGQRLELGEIEHRLEADPRIRHVIVIHPKTGLCKERLVAVLSLTDLSSADVAIGSSRCQVVQGPRMETARRLVSKVRDRLSDQLPPYMVPSTWAVVERIPMLVSGKLDRKQVANWVQNLDTETHDRITGVETPEGSTTPSTFTAKLLQHIWSRVLNLPIEKVKPDQSFISLGGDSITAMQVMARCRKEHINFSLHEVLKSKSVAHLALFARSGIQSEVRDETTDVVFDLSPIQQLYFQTHNEYTGSSRCNQSFSFRITRAVQAQEIDRAIETIVQQHSMLRAHFEKSKVGVWQQKITQDVASSYRFLEHDVPSHQIAPFVARAQSSLDIQEGPLLIVDLFNTEKGERIISLVAHHLVIDMVSWRIILQDLEELLLTQTLAVDKSLSFQSWCALQAEENRRERNEVLPCNVPPADMGFWGMSGKTNTYADVENVGFEVDEAITQSALAVCNKALRTEPIDIFLAVIAHSFTRVFGGRSTPTVFNEGHGREAWNSSLDLSRTVGWFTTIVPVHVSVDKEEDDIVDTIRRVKDIRRSTPGNGRPYFAHRFLTPGGRSRFNDHGAMEIIFNYLGRMQQLERSDSLFQQVECFTNEEEAKLTADVGPNATRLALFEVSAAVVNNKIRFSFVFNGKMQHQHNIRLWISECKRTLKESVRRLSDMRPERTLSDYPLLPIGYEGLQKMADHIYPAHGILEPDEIEDVYPCAPMQEGILLSQTKDPESYVFHTTYEIKSINGTALNADKLLKAWQKVVDRHAALRTTFIDSVYKGGVFDQIVVKKVDSGAVFFRCGDSDIYDKLGSVKIRDTNWKKLPKLPHQLSLCETLTGRFVIKLEVNHAVIDGGSIFVMMQDLAAAYEDRIPNAPSLLYSNYISYIRGQSPDAGMTFWKKYLDGVRPCSFPTLNKRPVEEKRLGAITLEFDRFSKLIELCEKWKVTLSNILQAAWALVLAHFTGSDDVCYGYLASGRDAPLDGIEHAVGAFINMLVFRLKIDRTKTLQQIFLQVQSDYLESLPFQHVSVARLQHDLGLKGQSLFNTAMSIQNYQNSSGVQEASIAFDQITSHDPSEYVVTANILTSRNQEMVVFRYWTDKVSDDQALELSRVMTTLLDHIIHRPQQTLGDLKLVSEAQNPVIPGIVNEKLLRTMVSQCVRETIERLFSTGELFRLNANEAASVVGRRLSPVMHTAQNSPTSSGCKSDSAAVEYPTDSSTDDEPERIRTTKKLDLPSRSTQKLRQLWSIYLGKDPKLIKNDSGFFDMGGDSIIAMQMAGAAREEGLVMKVADVFKNPTFADMASKVMMGDEIGSAIKSQTKKDSHVMAPAVRILTSDPYERYSLLKFSNVEHFLQERICPKVGLFRGGILDVFPVTNFQALAITGALLESKWMLNYFFFDGQGRGDIQRVKRAALRVVQTFDIFRTVFINYGDQFLQVVLRKLQPEFAVHETDQDLADYTLALQKKDKELGPRLGEPFVQFTVLKQKNSNRHRIIIRMSHAQYDGVCLGRIFTGLQAAYQGQPIPSSPPFSNYVRDSAGGISSQHYEYWRGFLEGASMTEIIHKDSPNYRKPTSNTVVLKKAMRLIPPSSESITPATMIKAAWSLVLAQITAEKDIIFGNVISGRNAAVPGVESIVGPCVNLIPVRVKFERGWTALDLLRLVQEQQVASMPYESLGFRDIIKHCTNWPDWIHFSTIVQHQNVDLGKQFRLGENVYTMGSLGTQENLADIVILSTPLRNGDVEITLSYTPDSAVPASFAEDAFRRLCEVVQSFSCKPRQPLPSPNEIANATYQVVQDIITNKPEPLDVLSTVDGFDKKLLVTLSDMLTRMWNQVLGGEDEKFQMFRIDSSFFDLGGDIIGLAQLASLLEQEGFKIKVEELIEHPIMLEQLVVLSSKQQEMQHEKEDWINMTITPALNDSDTEHKKTPKKLWRMRSDLAKSIVRKESKKWVKAAA